MKKILLIIGCIILIFNCSGCTTEDIASEMQYETNSSWETWQ